MRYTVWDKKFRQLTFCLYLSNALTESDIFGTHKQQFVTNSLMYQPLIDLTVTTVGGTT